MPHAPVRNRLFLLLIIALFVTPLAIAWMLVGQWRPTQTSNHGELLHPAQPVSHLQAQPADGQAAQAITATYLRGRWTLLYIGKGATCEQDCQTGLYDIRQVRLALGKDMGRAQTLFILTSAPAQTLVDWLHREHPVLTVGVADGKTMDFFTHAFGASAEPGSWIYLVDPLGNLFMRYRIGSNPKGILDDLKHLLKYSEIG